MQNSAAAATPNLVRVLIATTQGPVEIEAIIDLDEGDPSIVALGQGAVASEGLRAPYRNFVSPGLGVIAKSFGHDAFRLELSDDIHTGESWQLAVFIAHALHKQKRLAEKGVEATTLVWVTGRVDYHLRVEPINNLIDKIAVSRGQLSRLSGEGRKVHAFWPDGNRSEVADATRADLAASRVLIHEAKRVDELLSALGLPPLAARANVAGETRSRSPRVGRHGVTLLTTLLGVGVAAALYLASGAWKHPELNPSYQSCDVSGVRLGMSISEATTALKDRLPAIDIKPQKVSVEKTINSPWLGGSGYLDYQGHKASIHIVFAPSYPYDRDRPDIVSEIDYKIENPTDADRANFKADALTKFGSPTESGPSNDGMHWSQCPGLELSGNRLHWYDKEASDRSSRLMMQMLHRDCNMKRDPDVELGLIDTRCSR